MLVSGIQQSESVIYTPIHSFLDFFPIQVITEYWVGFPALYSRFLLAIGFICSSVLAWRIPGTREPGGLLSMRSHRVRHYWSNLAAAAAVCGGELPWWLSGEESACNAGDVSSIPGSGRSPGEGNGYPLQYSCLKNPMDRGAWWVSVRRAAKSQTQLSD